MIKLKNILLNENKSQSYEDSIESVLGAYTISKTKDGSGFTTFTIKNGRGDVLGKFCRFITNNQLNQVDGFDGPIYEIIDNHDKVFSKTNRLKLKK